MDLPDDLVALLRTPALCYVAVSDPANPIMFTQVRGRVVGMTGDGGEESIEALAHKYTGQPYAWYGGQKQTRLIVSIEADRITSVP